MIDPVHYHEGLFPPADLDWQKLIPLIGPANAAVARYDGTLSAIPNVAVLLSPLTTQEAVLSSRIEGTQATMGEVLEYEARGDTGDSDREADIWEVLNYRKAMRAAVDMLSEIPLCQRLIRETHKILLNSVRGHGKSPGEYHHIPNWIGPHGCTVEEATFVPIDAQKLPEAMSRWERYIHEGTPDLLVQLGILHAEFEAYIPSWTVTVDWGACACHYSCTARNLLVGPCFTSVHSSKRTEMNITNDSVPFLEMETGPVGASFS